MDMNDTLNHLKNLAKVYVARYFQLSSNDKQRWLGGMEAYLIELGKISAGTLSFDFLKIKAKIFGFIPYTREENYEEYIFRLVNEVINENDQKNME